jgi:microcin C transport system ATP-binding protein
MSTPILRIRDLCVHFPRAEGEHHQAVHNLHLDLHAGERFALVGESGSGKTVSALSILRLLPDARLSGQILWNPDGLGDSHRSDEFDNSKGSSSAGDRDLLSCSDRDIRAIRGREIAMVFQEPMSALNPLFTVGQQIAEVLELHEGLSTKAALARAIELLERTGVDEPARRAQAYPHQLSGGQRQRVVIAMALACKPKLLIADEPTTALDVTIREQVLSLLLEIQRYEGMAILLITHDLPLVERFADRVAVMQHGRLIETNATKTLFQFPQEAYTQKLLSSQPERMVAGTLNTQVICEARELSCRYTISEGFWKKRIFNAVDKATLTIRQGETLGVVGESGSGKSTLAQALLRLTPATTEGEIVFDGQSINTLSGRALRDLRKRMQIVFQDPFSALSPRMTVGEILGEGLSLHFRELSELERQRRMVEVLTEVGLSGDSLSRYPHEFSGGQRQRIAIARAVVLKPDLIVLDEPTSALDVSIQQQVLELLVNLQRRYGLAYLLITHDLAVVRALSHRVMVMQHGKVVESGATIDVLDRPQEAYTRALIAAAFRG